MVTGADLEGAPQYVASVLVSERSGQYVLTSSSFPGSRVLLLLVGDAVHRECIAGWSFVEAVGFLFPLLEL